MFPGVVAAVAISLFESLTLLASYITNGNVFPMPLGEEDEAEFLSRMEEGDETARNTLVERNLRLVAHMVKKFDSTGQDPDDLISIGTIGLIKAINTYNRRKRTRLATYAARCIENEILMYLRSIKKLRSEVMLYDPIGSDKEGNEISLLDILGTDPDAVMESVALEVEREKLYENIRRLSHREKHVLEMRYGLVDGIRKTQRDISRRLGISRSYVSRIEKRAITKLQEEMCPDG